MATPDELSEAEFRPLHRHRHRRRRQELGPWDTANAGAGLRPTATDFLAERLRDPSGSPEMPSGDT